MSVGFSQSNSAQADSVLQMGSYLQVKEVITDDLHVRKVKGMV